MAFLSGLAGIGKKLAGADGASPDLADAASQGGFRSSMGGLSSGLGSLSANMLGQPEPDRSQPLKRIPRPSTGQITRPLPLGTSPVGSLSAIPYSGEGVSTGGGFAT